MDEEEYSDDENILTKNLEQLKKLIPREAYNVNEEMPENNIDDDIPEDEEDENQDDDDEDEDDIIEEPKEETLRTAFSEFNDDEDQDEEEDDDEFYLQKFDENTQKKIIADFHPELQSHNYDEIDVLSRVIRDENGNIIDPLHKTLPFITRYEKARILGERAKQINSGAKPFVELEPNIIDGYVIALKEFELKKIPFIIKRPLTNGSVEYWKFEDLEILV